jgi:hypothetical protein
MLGIRKKVAAVAAANELREEERDAATSMLTASSADTGSGSDDTAPQHSEPPRVKLWDESSMQYRDHHPPAATVSSADATGLRREQVEPSIDAKCAVADEEHGGDVDGRIRFGSFESFDLSECASNPAADQIAADSEFDAAILARDLMAITSTSESISSSDDDPILRATAESARRIFLLAARVKIQQRRQKDKMLDKAKKAKYAKKKEAKSKLECAHDGALKHVPSRQQFGKGRGSLPHTVYASARDKLESPVDKKAPMRLLD